MAIPDIHKGKYIFHFTDARNLDSIIKNGLLCTNEKNKQGIKHKNIANQTIQERRASMDVTAGPGGKVHDYVPFYFSSINPMLLTLLNHKNCDQNLIIYLCIKIDKKMAEALIHIKVDISEIDAIVVYNEGIKKAVKQVFDENGIKAPEILFDHNQKMLKYGFYYTKFFFSDRKNETLVTGPHTLLRNYNNLIEEVRKERQKKNASYPYKTVKELVEALNQDITKLEELEASVEILQNYAPHNDTVGDHTKKVVAEVQKTTYYENASEEVKNVLLLGAYLHDIGKGPASKWTDGTMSGAYPDHPSDAIPMLGRILTEEIESLNDDEIRRLCMLVVYHDIIGECYEKGRDKQQIVDLIESEDDYDMLTAISIADATAVNGFWGKSIISGAAAMKGEVMKLKNG